MNQAYHLLQRRFEVDKLEVANESAAMKQCLQELECQATLKHAVVEYQASTYVDNTSLKLRPARPNNIRNYACLSTKQKWTYFFRPMAGTPR